MQYNLRVPRVSTVAEMPIPLSLVCVPPLETEERLIISFTHAVHA